jgi:putative ABC transport system ATP-binding protein
VMVTHDPVAASYTDRVLFLADGRIVDELRAPDRDRILAKMTLLQDVAMKKAAS